MEFIFSSLGKLRAVYVDKALRARFRLDYDGSCKGRTNISQYLVDPLSGRKGGEGE